MQYSKIYLAQGGDISEINESAARLLQNHNDFGKEFVICYCDNEKEAFDLAELYDAEKIGYDNIGGASGLVGLAKGQLGEEN